jgi:hypothetical protein
MTCVVNRQHVQPVNDVQKVQIFILYQFQQLHFVLTAFLHDYCVSPIVRDHLLEYRIPHVLLIKVKSLQIVQEQIQLISDSPFSLPKLLVALVPGPLEALHRVLIEELK